MFVSNCDQKMRNFYEFKNVTHNKHVKGAVCKNLPPVGFIVGGSSSPELTANCSFHSLVSSVSGAVSSLDWELGVASWLAC